ncbi:MAG: sulfite exporter TauE/SafE family protein [Coriobacteriales bacterium]|jgi:uncharacterized membrane protein YfcA|nr:sulfite exporter TauE/SafE family protein [Coriobacteriales bacterium]
MTVSFFILIACFGLLVGILSGMFGIGGGTMIIPLLHLVFNIPILASTATSLFVIAPTSVSGAWRHRWQGTVDLRAAVVIGASGAVTSAISSLFSNQLPDIVVGIAAAGVIFYSASSMLRHAFRQSRAAERGDSHRLVADTFGRTVGQVCLGLFAGLVAGVVGVGGGFIIVPVCVAYFGYTFKEASGTSLAAIAFLALPGIITHALLGHVWYLYGIALMIGTIPGANIGARIIAHIPERTARFAFGGLLVVSGAMLVVNQVILV